MVEGHLKEILAYWTRALTTVFMVGFSRLFSTATLRAFWYRTVENMPAVLHFVVGKLILPSF